MESNQRRIILSLDIEADGPAPLVHNCLMIGLCAVALDIDPKDKEWIIDKKCWCLKEQEGCQPDQKCLNEFWSKYPELRQFIRDNEQDVTIVMQELSDWLRLLNKKYIIETWIARPASFDYQWINCLYHKWQPLNKFPIPFSIQCLSSMYKLLGFIKHKADYRSKDLPHTHNALDDATGQAYQYCMLRLDLTMVYCDGRARENMQ